MVSFRGLTMTRHTVAVLFASLFYLLTNIDGVASAGSCLLNNCLCGPTSINCADYTAPLPTFTTRERTFVKHVWIRWNHLQRINVICQTFPAIETVLVGMHEPASDTKCPGLSTCPKVTVECLPHPGYVVDDVTDETRDKDLQDVKNEPPVEDPHKDLPMDNKPVSHEETPKYTKDVPDYVVTSDVQTLHEHMGTNGHTIIEESPTTQSSDITHSVEPNKFTNITDGYTYDTLYNTSDQLTRSVTIYDNNSEVIATSQLYNHNGVHKNVTTVTTTNLHLSAPPKPAQLQPNLRQGVFKTKTAVLSTVIAGMTVFVCIMCCFTLCWKSMGSKITQRITSVKTARRGGRSKVEKVTLNESDDPSSNDMIEKVKVGFAGARSKFNNWFDTHEYRAVSNDQTNVKQMGVSEPQGVRQHVRGWWDKLRNRKTDQDKKQNPVATSQAKIEMTATNETYQIDADEEAALIRQNKRRNRRRAPLPNPSKDITVKTHVEHPDSESDGGCDLGYAQILYKQRCQDSGDELYNGQPPNNPPSYNDLNNNNVLDVNIKNGEPQHDDVMKHNIPQNGNEVKNGRLQSAAEIVTLHQQHDIGQANANLQHGGDEMNTQHIKHVDDTNNGQLEHDVGVNNDRVQDDDSTNNIPQQHAADIDNGQLQHDEANDEDNNGQLQHDENPKNGNIPHDDDPENGDTQHDDDDPNNTQQQSDDDHDNGQLLHDYDANNTQPQHDDGDMSNVVQQQEQQQGLTGDQHNTSNPIYDRPTATVAAHTRSRIDILDGSLQWSFKK